MCTARVGRNQLRKVKKRRALAYHCPELFTNGNEFDSEVDSELDDYELTEASFESEDWDEIEQSDEEEDLTKKKFKSRPVFNTPHSRLIRESRVFRRTIVATHFLYQARWIRGSARS